jgi:single-stranded DNA-specific DHH superfamily exonuclease
MGMELSVNYLVGSKKEFDEFIELITSRDKIAIISHSDLDGLASALFLEKILNSQNVQVEHIEFLDINRDLVKKSLHELKQKNISKVFFCDISVDYLDMEGFNELRKEIDCFLIDHHPLNLNLENKKNIIKTSSEDCSALTIFDLGEEYFERDDWKWLLAAAIFSDVCYKKKEHFELLKELYPSMELETISSSVPGVNARKISSAMIYYAEDLEHVYELVKKRDLESITQAYEVIEEEVEKAFNDFSEKEDYHESKGIHFFEIESKFGITSFVATSLSKMKPEDVFIFYRLKDGCYRISARNHNGSRNMGKMMREIMSELEEASGGGHKAAAGGLILEKDFEEFKYKVLNYSF